MSMSAFPHGVVLVAASSGDTLALTALSSTGVNVGNPAESGVRTLSTGNVEELNFGSSWLSQNPGTEWIDGFTSSAAGDYEVQLSTGTILGGGNIVGPARGQFWGCGSTRQWTLVTTSQGTVTYSGTMTVREIANTSNSVSASVNLSSTWDQF